MTIPGRTSWRARSATWRPRSTRCSGGAPGTARPGRPRRCWSWPRGPPGPAAGPAEHARKFARRGLAATALDLNPRMCAHAAAEADREGVKVEVVQDDMTRFELGRRFDLVVTMLDSTSHLMTLDAFVAHLRRVAAHLSPGGLYIVEMSHPRDRLGEPTVSTGWTVERGAVRADVRWGEPSDLL